MEGLMKAAQIKSWWENPVDRRTLTGPVEEVPLCAPYSLLMHSDALWTLSGSDVRTFTSDLEASAKYVSAAR